MTAATERRIISRSGGALPERKGGTLKADEVVKQGWLCMYGASGYVYEAVAGAGYKSAGIAMQDADATGADDGAVGLDLIQGVVDLAIKTDGGDALTIADVGTVVYAVDNQTVGKVSTSRSVAGILSGINEENGCARVLVGDLAAAIAVAKAGTTIQAAQGTLTNGVLTVATGITTTSSSQVFVQLVTPGGTLGTEGYKAAVTVVGAPGVGTIVITAINDNAGTDTSDTSTVAYLIVG